MGASRFPFIPISIGGKMGLKYNVFMCLVSPEELMQRLVDGIPAVLDTSSLMQRHNEWQKVQDERLIREGSEYLREYLET